jgi:DNA-binding beta-propeller fold protein YncE
MPSLSTPRRALAAILALSMLLVAAIAPVAARDARGSELPTRIELPDGFQPEGIESRGRWLFTGSLVDGAIWRGSAVSGEGKILVEGVDGLQAAGLHLDHRGRLWVAGAGSGSVRVYSAFTGRLLETYPFPSAGFINDLDLVGNAVYATDSVNQQLLVIPLLRSGRLPEPSAATTMPLTGDLVYTTGFNANGIARSKDSLIVVQTNTGFLFKVDPATGATTRIDTGGYLVTNGDGLEIAGRTLYVVRNQVEIVAVLRLSKDRLSASLVGEISDPAATDVPTTATKTLGGLYVVNARFGTTEQDYWITRLPARP